MNCLKNQPVHQPECYLIKNAILFNILKLTVCIKCILAGPRRQIIRFFIQAPQIFGTVPVMVNSAIQKIVISSRDYEFLDALMWCYKVLVSWIYNGRSWYAINQKRRYYDGLITMYKMVLTKYCTDIRSSINHVWLGRGKGVWNNH